ncbi:MULTISPECIES: hypothetical protein [unclassified Dysgonomonas]|uniref:hypothetical protein n=1 Tax=unclassified Dysgonomonas TaxID=2630389 RepID=UPI0024748AA9|nr:MULTISPECIES: hypothetical protein [unclassified Dysgonomonas]
MEKTVEYFINSGFKLVANEKNRLIFTCGSLFRNRWTFNPLKWKSKIKIRVSGDSINADFIIDATGQIISIEENNTWDIFVENYRNFLFDNIDYNSINQKHIVKVRNRNIKLISWTLLGCLIGGVLSVILAILIGQPILIPVGIVGMAILFIIKRPKF